MEITIFKEVTTEGVITSIEENSKKYHEGFFADMNNAPERKLVKESSADIKGIIKELEAKRITINRDNTAKTNKECQSIVDRLEVANAPFTTLEDDYKAERKVILDAEKARKQAIIDLAQYENDHEMGLLINKTFEFDKAEEVRLANVMQKQLEEAAQSRAAANQVRINAAQEQDKINAENARLANKEHCAKVNNRAVNDLVGYGASYETAKAIVIGLAKKSIKNITINY